MREIITAYYPTHYLRFVVKSSPKVEQFLGIIPHDFYALEYVWMIEREHVVLLWSYFTASNKKHEHFIECLLHYLRWPRVTALKVGTSTYYYGQFSRKLNENE